MRTAVALKDVMATARGEENLKTLVSAIETAGLADILAGDGPYTLFAPSDPAFDRFVEGSLNELLHNKAELRAALSFHIVPGRHLLRTVHEERTVRSLLGAEVTVLPSGNGFKVENARVTRADLECSNGVIHLVDAVLMPRAG